MRMAEARAAIGDAVSAAIVADFEVDMTQRSGYVPGPPTLIAGECVTGHDASRVPDVPRAQLSVDRDSGDPGVIFTWKVESGDPPHVFAQVPPHWLRDVVRPGYAVIDGRPVLQILTRMLDGRPTRILSVAVGGYYDSSMRERANAQLKTWRILRKLRCCPWRAGQLAKAIHALEIHAA
jgi:hypothetical protein